MTTATEQVETQDTTAQQQQQGQPAAAPVQETGKATSEKVDIDRFIEGDPDYAEQVLTDLKTAEPKPDEEPADQQHDGQQAAPETAAPAAGEASTAAGPAAKEEPSIVLRYEGTEERIPLTQAQNRLQQAKHLQVKWEREVAPVARVIRQHPELAQALNEAAAGRPERLQAVLAGQPVTEQAAAEVAPEVFAAARKDPRLKHLTDEELRETLQTVEATAAARQAVTDRQQQDLTEQEQVLVTAHLNVLAALEKDPAEHLANLDFMNKAFAEAEAGIAAGTLKDENGNLVTREQYDRFRQAVDDPKHPENFLNLYWDIRESRRRALSGQPVADGSTAGAGSQSPQSTTQAPPPRRPAVSARLEPGAASTTMGGTKTARLSFLPDLANKSLDERRAAFDAFIET